VLGIVRYKREELIMNIGGERKTMHAENEPAYSAFRSVKFGNAIPNRPPSEPVDFELKNQAAEFFAYVRTIEVGVIRVLEVRGGLPFCMDVMDPRDW
jgi:hypothetical protein